MSKCFFQFVWAEPEPPPFLQLPQRMPESVIHRIAHQWQESLACFSASTREYVKKVAVDNKEVLAFFFYERMLKDEAAKNFLSNEQVHSRLVFSMQEWVVRLFSISLEDDFISLVKLQQHIGEVHSRIDLPLYLVLNGARVLKEKLYLLLESDAQIDHAIRLEAQRLVSDTVDIAIEFMSRAYAKFYDRKSRAEESYRVSAAIHSSTAEKGRQRAALLDWENQVMFDLAVGALGATLPTISASEFGLWFHHKGAHAFQNLHETKIILDAMYRIDNEFLTTLINLNHEQRIHHLRELRTLTRLIGLNLDNLFERQSELESGRDALTHLLGRKYLSVVLGKEVAYARNRGIQFALLSIDLDFFKNINDKHGHETGDHVLQQFAELLSSSCRAGDYVFRLGGEEFLVLLVDVNEEACIRIARALRHKINSEKFSLRGGSHLNLTTSMGITLYDGHPDYAPTLQRVDAALYEAKHAGRDRIYLSDRGDVTITTDTIA